MMTSAVSAALSSLLWQMPGRGLQDGGRGFDMGMPALQQGTSLVSEKVAKSEQTSPLNRCNDVGEYRVECETSQIDVARQ
jgi:hypothetical protein